MQLLKDYLRDDFKLYSPPTKSNRSSAPGVWDVEVRKLLPDWMPTEARHDAQMVDALIELLDECLGESPLSSHLLGHFKHISWRVSSHEDMSKTSALYLCFEAVYHVMRHLGRDFSIHHAAPTPGFCSRVDLMLLTSEDKKVLVEIKDPNVLDITANAYLTKGKDFKINWDPSATSVPQKVIAKACLYMASHKARWLALTSHDKWVFFRLHGGISNPYVSYSSVEYQLNSSRPLRALLGMMLAAEMDIDTEVNANMKAQVCYDRRAGRTP